MAISGIVLTLCIDPAGAESAIQALVQDSRIMLGDRFDRRVAAVAETPSAHADRDLWDDLRGTPGILNVDVTFVGLDEVDPEMETPDDHA